LNILIKGNLSPLRKVKTYVIARYEVISCHWHSICWDCFFRLLSESQWRKTTFLSGLIILKKN